MGYELKKLMNMYGVSTPTMAPAPQMPGTPPTAPNAPVLAENATKAQRKQYDKDLEAYNTSKEQYEKDKAAFDETVRKYGLDKAQYDQYAQEYQNRLANTNMYNQAQFSTTGANVPPITTFSDAQKAALGYGPTVTPTVGAPTVPDPNSGGIVDLAVVVYGPDGTVYSSPQEARAAGVTNYTMTPPDPNSGGTILPVPQPGPQDFSGIGQGGLNQQIQQYMGTNPSMPDLNAYMTRYGLTDYDIRNAMGTGTTYGTPQWSDAVRAPSYGMMPITFGQMSEQDRANWYNTQRGLGYTDADLRANAESTFGQMSDPDFSQMTGGAYTPPSISNPTGSSNGFLRKLRKGMQSTGEAYTPPSVSNPTSSSNGFLRRLGEGMQSNRAEGGYIQNYAQGGTVRGYAPGGIISGGAGNDVLMGRPAGDMLTPAPVPVVEDPQDAMMAMLERYAAPVDRSAEIAAAAERRAAEQKAFEEMLLGQLDAQDNAPQSKAEMYFRLAAAFGAPTKTGHFSENLALVGQTMADELAAKAKREREAREKKLGVRTELQKMRMEAAGEELGTLRGLQEDETKYGRELARDLIKDYIASGKPQSEAGRIAMDMGLKPGTPEFNDEVRKQTELKIQRELAAIQAQIASTASSTAAAGRMSSTEINLRTETENNLANLNQALSDVAEAYRLNPNSYSGSLTDTAVRKLQETVGSDDPMIVNTRRIENLLGQQALGTLKAVFGGNPTEGERAILLELQGIGAKSLEERGEIMLRLYEVLQERQARETKRLDDILSGAYRSYTPIDGGE